MVTGQGAKDVDIGFQPALAPGVNQHVGPKRRGSQTPCGCNSAAVRNNAVESTRTAAESTYRPSGIVHSIAWLLSSVASAKYSARPPALPAEATSETGLPSHRDRRPSVPCPGPTAVQPSGRVIIGSSP